MRGSPPCEVALRHFGVWRMALALTGLSVSSTLAAWAFFVPQGPSSPLVTAIALIGGAVTIVVCASLWFPRSGILRWDGLGWDFAAGSTAGPSAIEAARGQVIVSIDLGAFILLRFIVQAPSQRRSVLWLPVQRRGLEREWHSFRCAVYSPRPVVAPAGADAPAP